MPKPSRPQPDLSELSQYPKGFTLIPLFAYDTVDRKGRERGKSPVDRDWRNVSYSRDAVLQAARTGRNVGVRLSPDQLVVDVDPRRFPERKDPLREFCEATGLDPSKCPTVNTGSGGVHLYLRKPAGSRLVDSLADFPGVEFKSDGRQVVAAGSIHPNGRLYTWNDFRPSLADLPVAPDKLLALAARPDRVTGATDDGGDLSPEELAKCLEQLDPRNYAEHDAWLALMMACHHATAGEGRQEFIDWSTGDPSFSDHSWEIGRRWDSLKPDSGGVTVRTLYGEIIKAGGQVPRPDARDDFEPLSEDERKEIQTSAAKTNPDGTKRLSPLEEMNRRFCIVDYNGVFRVMREVHDPVLERTCYYRYRRQDFIDLNADKLMENSEGKLRPVAEEWIKWPKHRKYNGVIFNPDPNRKASDDADYLNLWRGWMTAPAKGDWSLMQELIYDVLVDKSEAGYSYVLNWMAHMFQRPHRQAEVAIAFRGGKGTGKGTLCRALVKLAGQHGLHISSPEHLAGRFNGHLRDCVFLFADEAFYAGNKAQEAILKQLVTEPTVAYERKGQDIEQGRNMIHIAMASNSDWVVPAGLDERRFAVFDVSNAAQGNHGRFAAINQQMYHQGGLEAMLYDMLTRDIAHWHPRDDIPQNKALATQKIRSLDAFGNWWYETLMEGRIVGAIGEWEDFPILVPAPVLFDLYNEHAKRHNIRSQSTPLSRISVCLNAYVDGIEKKRLKLPDGYPDFIPGDSQGKVVHYRFPPLDECRKMFDQRMGSDTDWLDG